MTPRPRPRVVRASAAVLWAALVGAAGDAPTAAHRVVVERYPDGSIRREVSYRLGTTERDGVTRGWYESGKLEYERSYRRDIENGTHSGWYENGARKFEYHYERGLSVGVQRQWYPSGRLYTLFHYKAGHEEGQQQMWNPDGTIRSNYVIKDGRRFGLIGSTGCTGRSERSAL